MKAINAIADQMITRHKEADQLFALIPDGAKEGIAKRDAPKK